MKYRRNHNSNLQINLKGEYLLRILKKYFVKMSFVFKSSTRVYCGIKENLALQHSLDKTYWKQEFARMDDPLRQKSPLRIEQIIKFHPDWQRYSMVFLVKSQETLDEYWYHPPKTTESENFMIHPPLLIPKT